MKKAVSKATAIVIAVVVALGAVILTLSLVKAKPLDFLEGYVRAEIYDQGNSSDRVTVDFTEDVTILDTDTDAQKRIKNVKLDMRKAFIDGFDGTGFAVMQGILEGRPTSDKKILTENVDGEDVYVEYDSDGIESGYVAPGNNQYRIVLHYGEKKTTTVEDKEITFDTAILFVGDTQNTIMSVQVLLYDSTIAGSETPEEEDYVAYPFTLNAIGSSLYNAAADIILIQNERL